LTANQVLDKRSWRQRTKRFAIAAVRLYRVLPKSIEAQVIGKQFLRSGTSVDANYRAVCRARSGAEFLAKIGVVLEEADESLFWLEMMQDCDILKAERLERIKKEALELSSIFASAQHTARARLKS
jgi:four helix bundle protein